MNSSDSLWKDPEQKTLVLIKPDALADRLAGVILSCYETAGLELDRLALMRPDEALLCAHYAEHAGKSFLPELLAFMQEGPVIAAVLKGADAVNRVRALNGATDPACADSGTIRGRYGASKQRNCVHGSASEAEAAREIALWFPD